MPNTKRVHELLSQLAEHLRTNENTTPDHIEEARSQAREEARREAATYFRRCVDNFLRESPATPLQPTREAPTVSPEAPEATPVSLPARKQRVRDYLAAHPGAKYRALSTALGQYVATAVYALEKAGEVVKDEIKGFWLKSDVGAQPHARANPDRH